MGRGLGKIQKAIVKLLEDNINNGLPNSINLTFLMQSLFDIHPLTLMLGASYGKEYSSLKRAVRTLEQRGIIGRASTPKSCIVWLIRSSRGGTLKRGFVDREVFDRKVKETEIS